MKKINKDRLIFVTNDDGFSAAGFEAAIEVAREFGRVFAVAPATGAGWVRPGAGVGAAVGTPEMVPKPGCCWVPRGWPVMGSVV